MKIAIERAYNANIGNYIVGKIKTMRICKGSRAKVRFSKREKELIEAFIYKLNCDLNKE